MTRIGLLSDTHGTLPPGIFTFFEKVDTIWHAGDIGTAALAAQLHAFKPLVAVHGNIDGQDIRIQYPEYQLFNVDEVRVLMTHIGGYPGHYHRSMIPLLEREKPDLFITGHSHILKVIHDPKRSLLHMNPGAAGNNGWHHVITYLRFCIEGKRIFDLEIGEQPRK